MSSNSYTSRIKDPTDLGVSAKGKIKYMVKDVKAMANYVNVLTRKGPWKALKNGEHKSIGSSSFFKTGTTCKNVEDNGDSADRYFYNDAIPYGKNKSLIFSIAGDIENMNPLSLLDGLKHHDNTCKKVNLQVRQPNGDETYEERAVNINEIEAIDPCRFKEIKGTRKNVQTGKSCKEGFSVYHGNKKYQNVYNLFFCLLLLYLFRCAAKART